jgi:LmbE family N-acetylglucosaminyl deacetylase
MIARSPAAGQVLGSVRVLCAGTVITHGSIRGVIPGARWLAVTPHDDDVPLGMGLLCQAAIAEGVEVHVAVVCDGSLGYTRPEQRAGLAARRRGEMYASMEALGVERSRVHWLDFPESDLPAFQGRKQADVVGAYGGIAHALTGLMRAVRPDTVFAPTSADLHPDHRVCASETDIATFHASGEMWLELGAPIPLADRWDYAVYCPFPQAPDLQIRTSDAAFARKLDAIACFASQPQIGALVANIRAGGPVECFSHRAWKPYSPADYSGLFEG